MGLDESSGVEGGLEFVPGVCARGGFFRALGGAVEQGRLDFLEQSLHVRHDACSLDNFLGLRVAARHFDGSSSEVAGTHGQTHRYPFQFVLSEFPTAALRVIVVDLHPYTGRLQFIGDAVERSDDFRHLVFALVNGYKYDFDGSQLRWKNESCIVRVRHDQSAHQAGGHAP